MSRTRKSQAAREMLRVETCCDIIFETRHVYRVSGLACRGDHNQLLLHLCWSRALVASSHLCVMTSNPQRGHEPQFNSVSSGTSTTSSLMGIDTVLSPRNEERTALLDAEQSREQYGSASSAGFGEPQKIFDGARPGWLCALVHSAADTRTATPLFCLPKVMFRC